MRKLPRAFYDRNTIDVAIQLLGCEIVSLVGGSMTKGVIVETEAYRGPDDPACHAFVGRTRRNDVMFGPPGRLYVYFTYGNHYMLNVVTEHDGYPAAVLLRAAQPNFGLDAMQKRRGTDVPEELCSGPGKLARALGITTTQNGADLRGSRIYIKEPSRRTFDIMSSPRIGIGQRGHKKLWRFYIKDNPHVSMGSKYVRDNCRTLTAARHVGFKIG
ncbi:MAG: hypothetical protein A2W25_01540 [candidate division Zixibacteria bacterium RBG_16_53_22]|nr:MAG: hypothetical protein A2W25_01540 [candidate division Zixibacteria bacterium RBG_16_53_22]